MSIKELAVSILRELGYSGTATREYERGHVLNSFDGFFQEPTEPMKDTIKTMDAEGMYCYAIVESTLKAGEAQLRSTAYLYIVEEAVTTASMNEQNGLPILNEIVEKHPDGTHTVYSLISDLEDCYASINVRVERGAICRIV